MDAVSADLDRDGRLSFAEFARAERRKWGPLIQAAGIRAD